MSNIKQDVSLILRVMPLSRRGKQGRAIIRRQT